MSFFENPQKSNNIINCTTFYYSNKEKSVEVCNTIVFSGTVGHRICQAKLQNQKYFLLFWFQKINNVVVWTHYCTSIIKQVSSNKSSLIMKKQK